MGQFREKIQKVVEESKTPIKTKELLSVFCELMERLESQKLEIAKYFGEKVDDILSGPHFTERSLEKALNCIVKRDGSKGKYWSLEQTNDVASQGRLEFTKEFNQYDFCYAMNYCRAKYENSIRSIMGDDNVKIYFELAKSWRPDGRMIPEGGIWSVYHSLHDRKKLEEEV